MSDLVNAVWPGQCRLQRDSSSQISLQRYGGGYISLKISGVWEAKLIPSSGPTLANTGLTAATKYYIYAYDNSGTLTLEASTTGHAVDADTGVEIKSGDATRTLVGMVYMGAGSPGTFVDSATQRFVLNWYNRRLLGLQNNFTTNRTTNSTTWAEVNTEIRCEFLTWADEAITVGCLGLTTNSTNGSFCYASVGFDGTTPDGGTIAAAQAAGNTIPIGFGWVKPSLSEGYHYATFLGAVNANTATYYGGAISGTTVVNRLALSVQIRG